MCKGLGSIVTVKWCGFTAASDGMGRGEKSQEFVKCCRGA